MASQSLSVCREDGCESPVHATGLCGKHKKQEQRQRAAFIKVVGSSTCPETFIKTYGTEWKPEYFVADPKVKKGRNPGTQVIALDRYKADMGAAGWAADIHENLTRLPDKAKTKHLPKEGDSAADVRSGKRWEANWRSNATREFKSAHWAERDRAMFLGQGKLPLAAHVPTIPATFNPAGWGRSPSPSLAGSFTQSTAACGPKGLPREVLSGYRVAPRGVSKPCKCKSCKMARKSRMPR